MAELRHQVEKRKVLLIEQLISNGVFKTLDERHLYDAPLKALEKEYDQISKKRKTNLG